MAQTRLCLSRADAAAYIEKTDADRRRWTHYLYGVDWGDPSLYDVVLNLEHLTIEQACNAVAALARQRCFHFTAECQSRMNDVVLASRVRAALVLNPSTSHLEVEVQSRDGLVDIRAKLRDTALLRDVEQVSSSVPGVVKIALLPAAQA